MSVNDAALLRYYRLHAGIYDATRWSFLFGREALLKTAAGITSPRRVLEIGCGTGRNLLSLCRLFPDAELTGVDLSGVMLDKAWQKLRPHQGRVKLIQQAYGEPLSAGEPMFDLVVCSYALSMFNPGWDSAIDAAALDVVPGGHFALVDFHDSAVPAFSKWMGVNHVRMEGHLRPRLQEVFDPVVDRVNAAYGGLWRYHTFVGRKTAPKGSL